MFSVPATRKEYRRGQEQGRGNQVESHVLDRTFQLRALAAQVSSTKEAISITSNQT